MSPINFEILASEYPQYSTAWSALKRWFSGNSVKRYIELSVLLNSLASRYGHHDKVQAILAIESMVDKGMLEVAYRVKAPGGYLLEGDFERPDTIPKELPDRDESGQIRTEDADIVSGYRWETADAA